MGTKGIVFQIWELRDPLFEGGQRSQGPIMEQEELNRGRIEKYRILNQIKQAYS